MAKIELKIFDGIKETILQYDGWQHSDAMYYDTYDYQIEKDFDNKTIYICLGADEKFYISYFNNNCEECYVNDVGIDTLYEAIKYVEKVIEDIPEAIWKS